jgi:hypothetical protein
VPYGILRVDKIRLLRMPVKLTLGAYGFPDHGTDIIHLKKGDAKAILLKGHDHNGRARQLAMTVYDGWEGLSIARGEGLNPDSGKSVVVYAKALRRKQYGNGPYIMVSQVITKESREPGGTVEDFSEREIFPISQIGYEDRERAGGHGTVTVYLTDGGSKRVDFSGIEGNLRM